MKIDAFNHVFPARFLERVAPLAPSGAVRRWQSISALHDIDARLRVLDAFDDVRQIISLSQPPLDDIAGPDETPELARLANDCMQDICTQHPDRFPGFVATPAMNNPDSVLAEIERAIVGMGALGLQIHTNVNGKALDQPEFFPIFARMAELDKPIWLHPARPMQVSDYQAEDVSRYEIWWGLGWAYDTSAAMARIVFSGMFDKLPNLKIITHHWGAYIPHAEGRITPYWQERKSQSADHAYGPLSQNLERQALSYFKMFYADTAMFGAEAASRCGLEFFGAAHSVFATDAPYDHAGGAQVLRDTIAIIDALDCTPEDRQAIYSGNIERLVGRAL
ncbi:MAG: amidohydrolase family protein [Hyphomicrobiaceae bacterium]